MLNKILVFWWLALGAILVIENIVGWWYAYIFIDDSGSAYMLSFISIIIWILMWYWLRWMFESNNWDSDNYDF
jgi:hypothetical protein